MSVIPLTNIFGNNIRKSRKGLYLTQVELAERLGIGQQSLSRIESGVTAPKFERLEDIEDVLQCSVSALFHAEPCEKGGIDRIVRESLQDLQDLQEKEQKIILKRIAEVSAVLKEGTKRTKIIFSVIIHCYCLFLFMPIFVLQFP